MRRLLVCAAIPFLLGAGPADQPRQLSLTIYNGDLALVQDVRALDVAAGRSRLEFKDVSGRIRPETVSLSGKGLSVVEQNFDFDLLTPEKMMEKAVGKQIQIVRTNPGTGKETTETATVLSVNAGVVLKIGNRIEVLRDDGVPTRVIFDGIPENLRARPTLSVTVEAAGGGARSVALSYLTTGLSWTADYVAEYDEKQNNLNLQGWVTLTNATGTSFTNVAPRLVAGEVSTGGGDTYPNRGINPRPANRGAGTVSDRNEDFPVYTLPQRVTVADNQTKQVGFLTLNGLKARKIYEYRADGFTSQQAPEHASVALAFTNTTRAMPAGAVRVYTRDEDGAPKFSGEQKIDQTPAGSELTITQGEAFDVTVQGTVVTSEGATRNRMRYGMSYALRNARAQPVTVELRQGGLYGRDSEISDESLPGKQLDARTRLWTVTVPANGQTILTFSARVGG